MTTSTALLLASLLVTGTWATALHHDAESRLLGGSTTSGNEPYVALIVTYDAEGNELNTCGGAIINATVVVTTAFCVYKALTAEVYAGSNVAFDKKMQYADSQMIIIHPEFSKNTMENDIALIKVTPAFDLTANVKTIRLASTKATTKDALAGTVVTIFGWGDVEVSDELLGSHLETPAKLQTLDVPVGATKDCQTALKQVYYSLPSTSFCSNTTFLSKQTCSDDWGSPIVARIGTETTYSLVGLASKYVRCPRVKLTPDMFTQIGVLNKWIEDDGGPLAIAK